MANVVAKVLVKMKLLTTDKVVFVNNPLELLAGYVGQTPAKVDAKIEEAAGGCIFIDEAYSLLKEASGNIGGGSTGNTASFAKVSDQAAVHFTSVVRAQRIQGRQANAVFDVTRHRN